MEGVKKFYKSKKRTASKAKVEKPAKRRKTDLGIISAKITPSKTTLSTVPGPFSGIKNLTFIYENELTSVGATTAFTSLIVAFNDMYDFDKTANVFGNKQPLYFDQLLDAAGPYRQFKVLSWKTTYTVVNSSDFPITVFILPPHADSTDMNSAVECDNWPGVKRLFLAPKGSECMGTATITGHIRDVYQDISQNGLVGTSTASPGVLIYGGLGISSTSTTPTVHVAIRHEAYTELNNVDALVS